MAVDKSYGSGKSRSAANSRSRRRVAAGQMTKGKPKSALSMSRVARGAGNVADFIVNGPKENQGKYLEVGISPLKLAAAIKALISSGKVSKAMAVDSRLAARLEGKFQTGNINDVRMREQSTSVFPRIGSTKIRTAPNRILEEQGRRRYNEMDKFNDYMSGYPTSRAPKTTVTRGVGTVNPEGYAALQKKPDFLGQGAKQIARNIKKTPKKVSKAEMDRIATKGFTRSEIDEFTDFANKYYANQARLRAKFGKNK